jgi:hypothetical protein
MQDWQLRLAGQTVRPGLTHAPIGECVAWLESTLDLQGMRRLGEYRQAWQQVVPDALREHAQVVGLRGGTLTVAVDGAAQRYLLQVSLKATLLSGLNGICGGKPIRDLRFVLAQSPPDMPGIDAASRSSTDTDGS